MFETLALERLCTQKSIWSRRLWVSLTDERDIVSTDRQFGSQGIQRDLRAALILVQPRQREQDPHRGAPASTEAILVNRSPTGGRVPP